MVYLKVIVVISHFNAKQSDEIEIVLTFSRHTGGALEL